MAMLVKIMPESTVAWKVHGYLSSYGNCTIVICSSSSSDFIWRRICHFGGMSAAHTMIYLLRRKAEKKKNHTEKQISWHKAEAARWSRCRVRSGFWQWVMVRSHGWQRTTKKRNRELSLFQTLFSFHGLVRSGSMDMLVVAVFKYHCGLLPASAAECHRQKRCCHPSI